MAHLTSPWQPKNQDQRRSRPVVTRTPPTQDQKPLPRRRAGWWIQHRTNVDRLSPVAARMLSEDDVRFIPARYAGKLRGW
jgi:hypothetical protein